MRCTKSLRVCSFRLPSAVVPRDRQDRKDQRVQRVQRDRQAQRDHRALRVIPVQRVLHQPCLVLQDRQELPVRRDRRASRVIPVRQALRRRCLVHRDRKGQPVQRELQARKGRKAIQVRRVPPAQPVHQARPVLQDRQARRQPFPVRLVHRDRLARPALAIRSFKMQRP